ncbi:unnamed protein product [Pylaiella littoralis]
MSRSTAAAPGAAAQARASSLVCLAAVWYVGMCGILPMTTAFQQSTTSLQGRRGTSSSSSSRRTAVGEVSSAVRAFGAVRSSGGASTRRQRRSSRPNWWVAGSSAAATAVQDSPPATQNLGRGFDPAQISDVLEHEYRADLVRLAQKFGELIGSVEDVETISIMELDGDHIQLDVVYCDHGEQTCVAVAVPIAFPHHCDDGNSVINAIHELKEMEHVVPYGGDVKLTKKPVSPELMETMAKISVVMNRDFQDELVGFVRAFGGSIADKPLGSCEMQSLTPDGFLVKAALFPHDPVPITFPKECQCARDFQKQILEISKQAMIFA